MSKPTQYTTPHVPASAVGKRWRRLSPRGFMHTDIATLARIESGPSYIFGNANGDVVHIIDEPGWTLVAADKTQDTLEHPYPTPDEVRARQQAERERDLKALRERVCAALRTMAGRVQTIDLPASVTDEARLQIVQELRALGWYASHNPDGLRVELPENATQEPSSEASPNQHAPDKSQDATLPEGWKRRPDGRYGPRIIGPDGAYVETPDWGFIVSRISRKEALPALRAYLALLPDDPS